MKLLWRTPIKIHRRADRRRQPRSREHRFSTAKATSSTQRPQTCTEAATKYYNYIVNETDEEREHRLPTLPKATRLDQATLNVYSQNSIRCDFVKILRCSDRRQDYARQEVLSGIWNPIISGQIVNSFGQGKCTFDCQSGNLKNYAFGNHVSTSSCMLRIEILITFNVTCMWTFHTNSLLHEYLFLMHLHKSLLTIS